MMVAIFESIDRLFGIVRPRKVGKLFPRIMAKCFNIPADLSLNDDLQNSAHRYFIWLLMESHQGPK